MVPNEKEFKKGDWIVHPIYGVGKIRKIEKKRINEKKIKYFRVEADETTYWVPVEGIEESRARKVINQSDFQKAVQLLKKAPHDMDSSYKNRQMRIKEVLAEGLLRPTTRLARDLWARSQNNKLNDTERATLRKIMDNLVDEWAVAENISTEEANTNLSTLLNKNPSISSEYKSADPLSRIRKLF